MLASPAVTDPAPYCTCKFPEPVPLELLGKVIGNLCRKCARRIKKP